MEPSGDPVVDFLEKLINFINRRIAGMRLRMPPGFSAYPNDDQRIWLDNIYQIATRGLGWVNSKIELKAANADMPIKIKQFIEGAPRPEIIG